MLLAAAGWLGWQAYRVITHAHVFQISGVDVKGVRQLTEADLKEIVGVFTGQNIFQADLNAAVIRAQANPWINSISISRRLPDRISMVVTERVPFAILDTGKNRFLVDVSGVVITRVPNDQTGLWPFPAVSIKDYRAMPGEQIALEGMHEALKLLGEITKRGGWELQELTIKAGTPESLTVVYAGHEFRFGSGRYGEKLKRLFEVMTDMKQRGQDIAYVDLRPMRQVAVMPKKEEKRVTIRKKRT